MLKIEIYRSENDTEGYFEVCLEILRLNPNDELANQEVGLIALGDSHYSIAEIYLKAAMQASDEPQLVLAYAVTQWQLGEPFQIVFCRNVMIYFDAPTQRKVLERIHKVMRPQGLLFVGHSENFTESKDLFRLRGKTIYERV